MNKTFFGSAFCCDDSSIVITNWEESRRPSVLSVTRTLQIFMLALCACVTYATGTGTIPVTGIACIPVEICCICDDDDSLDCKSALCPISSILQRARLIIKIDDHAAARR